MVRRPRIALLGGAFDPPHLGHLLLAEVVLETTDHDAIWWVPSGVHPWSKTMATWASRAALVSAVIAGRTGMALCDIEHDAAAPTYTVDTVEALIRRHPDIDFSFVCGADAAAGLPTWHRWETLRALVEFVVVGRGGLAGVLPDGARGQVLPIELPAISSTEVRRRQAGGEAYRHLVPAAVYRGWRQG